MKKPAPLSHGAGEMDDNTSSTVRVLDRSKPKQRTATRSTVAESDVEIAHAIEIVVATRNKPMTWCDDASGLQDGYTAKILHPLSPNGRVPSGPIRDLLLRALFPNGYRFVIVEKTDEAMLHACGQASSSLSARDLAKSIVTRRNLRSRLTEEWGRQGGRARRKKLSAERRSEIARAAAAARWQRRRGS